MNIKKDYALKKHNTFGIDAHCDWFIQYDNIEDLRTLSSDEYFQECKMINIGEGSNLLFLSNFHGIVLSSNIKIIDIIEEKDSGEVDILVGSGVVWDNFVEFAVNNGLWGIENLSSIPGTVGASAIQNIGAYGVEVCSVIKEVHFFDFDRNCDCVLKRVECDYGYRSSIFKKVYPRISIHHVIFSLNRKGKPNISYPDLIKVFGKKNDISLNKIRTSIIDIRKNKLPDVKKLGNAGSFFMNPIITVDIFEKIKKTYPDVPSYPITEEKIKIPAGWLIEKCGLKGYREGNVGVYEKQALVIINYGGATGREIGSLAEKIIQTVKKVFSIDLQPEVKYIL